MAKVGFGLIRVSTSEQNMDSQKERLRKIANDLGYEIADRDFFADKITGYDENDEYDRPSIVALRDEINIRRPNAIFCLELSRLSRRAIKVARYIDWLSVLPKIPMYFADYALWTIDTKTLKPLDDNIMTLQGGAKGVEIERERIRSRTMRGRDAKAEKGFFVGHLSDGYIWEYQNGEKVIKKDEQRAPLIKNIFEMYVEQEYSTGMIRDVLNSEIDKYPPTNRYRKQHPELFRGYKEEYRDRSGNYYSREGLLWTDAGVSQILRDEWYKGTRHYKDKAYPVDPIVDEELWDRAQNRLSTFRFINNKTTRKYLLTGRLYCGTCGRKMYGHGDGYNNMYYCSSKEYGTVNKCGLRWIRQENLDSIVFNIIKARATEDIRFGERTVFSDFFEPDSKKAKEIENEIKTHNKIIKRADANIDTLQRRIDFYIQKQGEYIDNQLMVSRYDKQIEEVQREIASEEKTKHSHTIEIERLKKRKKTLLSIADKLSKVSSLAEFDEMRALLFSVISRIVVYNPDKTSSVIRIEYVNGEADYAIYNPTRLQKRYIFLSQDYQQWTKMSYDTLLKEIIFTGYYLGIGPNREILFNEETDLNNRENADGGISLGTWNTEENRNRIESELRDAVKKGLFPESSIKDFQLVYEQAVKDGIVWNDIQHAIQCLTNEGLSIYKGSIPVIDYVNIKRRKGAMNVYEYDDLLPMTEEGLKRRNWHREYYKKKYNTGKPTFTEFVEKDADYERICRERKHLYNRKYKILKNKHLSTEQKESLIFRIMEQLEAYKYQLKYMPSNKKGEQYIKKYNTPKET